MTDGAVHREQRELLGAFVLGHLSAQQQSGVQAHLDGCADCRVERAEIAAVVPDLSALDPRGFGQPDSPPPELGKAILAAVARERVARTRQRARRGLLTGVAACLALTAVLGLGVVIGERAIVPSPPTAGGQPRPSSTPAKPLERVTLRSLAAGVVVQSAVIVPHTWGVELRFAAVGLQSAATYRAAFRTGDGSMRPAGEFIGVGSKQLTCNMQSSLLRPEVTSFVVLDDAGQTVLVADLKI